MKLPLCYKMAVSRIDDEQSAHRNEDGFHGGIKFLLRQLELQIGNLVYTTSLPILLYLQDEFDSLSTTGPERACAATPGAATASGTATPEIMNKTKEILQSEIRYAIRLTERTARLYRLVQTVGVFLSILGGSAAIASFSGNLPTWLLAVGAALLAISGAALIAVRPADKAAQNENDVHRYRALMTKSHALDVDQLAAALEEAHQTDAPEVEPLREVAYNDIALESNRPDVLIPLTTKQKILSALA